jgi:putative endonuclease|tara:strand:+ start:1118 stop:1480 length:363 start_codon:yes stop_codon:yes gene_type:complete
VAAATTISVGNKAERQAEKYLVNRGYHVVERNFRSKLGEIDLVLKKDHALVFVEVRYRSDSTRGTPAETVTRSKIGKIIRIAEVFLLKNNRFNYYDCRFDVIAISNTLTWTDGEFTLDDY